MKLSQGHKTLNAHHEEIHHLLRGMKKTFSCAESHIKSRYASSLTHMGTCKKLLRIIGDDKEGTKTIESLMIVATREARLNNIVDLSAPKEATVSVVQQTESVKQDSDIEECEIATISGRCFQRQSNDNRHTTRFNLANNRDSQYCPIHEAKTHSFDECCNKGDTHCVYFSDKLHPGDYVDHLKQFCKAKRCYFCNKRGHIERTCRAKECTDRGGDGSQN